ncbi:LPXTG cell wall anchor domain-containing protein [Arthrobacter sp. H35-D1]|uniref:LPXTG cell wall anchor domain-containing protein n=1 Tax=Arthrobacter sp. H35-D1 TaxID=3046202 RepID=UPI0024BB8FBA|nr:LPXTG cell wall anchor domain-containing protein [Arthrobacter sp. H35-D1]MDJ0313328.1 LPXTG cell wall anchor domain-containing protein [Arthrobacter sp. H35-D1]
MKKILAGVALAGILTLSAGTVAAQAAPGYPGAPPSSVGTVLPGEGITFSGSGFTPGETIDITVTLTSFVAGDPIRSLPASTTMADANGAFSTVLVLGWEEGTYTLTATGQTSGATLNDTVTGIASGPVAEHDDPSVAKDGMVGQYDDASVAKDGMVGQPDGLAYTGIEASTMVWSLVGAGALGAGVGLVAVSRRRNRVEQAAWQP